MTVAFATLGCKVNHYETQAMQALFESAGWTVEPFTAAADVYVVNTCTVTGVSDSKSRQLIARAHKRNPDALIAAVGCYAQSDRAAVAALPGVGLVLGTRDRSSIVERVTQALNHPVIDRQPVPAPDIAPDAAAPQEAPVSPDVAHQQAASPLSDAAPDAALQQTTSEAAPTFELLSAVRDSRTRATLKIQDGCANFCAYCIIPYARGAIRSRPLADVRTQLVALANEGYREVVLTGIHLASFGKDLGDCSLLDALALTQQVDGLSRIRLGSLEPGFVDEAFVQAVADNGKICRQFHLSLQSGSDAVLTRMRRRYTTAEYAHAVSLLRSAMPDCAITTDVIAGFCGETQSEHEQTMAFAKEMQFARMHVFPFSIRKGTAAAAMPDQLPSQLKEARAKELIALGAELTNAYIIAQLGKTELVLIEQNGEGYTGNYVRVKTPFVNHEGDIVPVRLTAVRGQTLIGEEIV